MVALVVSVRLLDVMEGSSTDAQAVLCPARRRGRRCRGSLAERRSGGPSERAHPFEVQSAEGPKKRDPRNNVTTKERLAAAKEMKAAGFAQPAIGVAQMAMPDAAPHYFTHPNYANTKRPTAVTTPTFFGNPVDADRAYATDDAATVFVVNPTPLEGGTLEGLRVWNQVTPGGSASGPSAGKSFHVYVLRLTAAPNHYTVVFDSGLLTIPQIGSAGVSEVVTFSVGPFAVQAGDLIAHYGQGIPLDVTGTDLVYYPVAAAPAAGGTVVPGSASFPTFAQTRAYSLSAQVAVVTGITGGIRKFVDSLPLLYAMGRNNLGQYLSVANPDTITYPGSDYYEIAVREYTEQMHSDLLPTRLRGYVRSTTAPVSPARTPSRLIPSTTSGRR